VAPRGSRPLRHIATLPLCSTAHYCPHSLSALQLIIVPIPSLLCSSLLSPFPLCSAAHYCPHSLSALQCTLAPFSLLYCSFLSIFPIPCPCYTAHSRPNSISALQFILVPIPPLLCSSFSSLLPCCSRVHTQPYSLSALQLILVLIPSLLYSSFLSYSVSALHLIFIPIPSLLHSSFLCLFPLCSTSHFHPFPYGLCIYDTEGCPRGWYFTIKETQRPTPHSRAFHHNECATFLLCRITFPPCLKHTSPILKLTTKR
jgi:hypothetical protein